MCELDRLKEVADATHDEVLEHSAAVARMSERMALLAAERARLLDAQPAHEPADSQGEGVQCARKCIGDIIVGVRNYGNELPQVQRF